MFLIIFQSRRFYLAIYTPKKWKIHIFSLYASSIVKNTISCRVELERDAAGIKGLVKMMLYMLHFHHGFRHEKRRSFLNA
jgi:hypothetical protein